MIDERYTQEKKDRNKDGDTANVFNAKIKLLFLQEIPLEKAWTI